MDESMDNSSNQSLDWNPSSKPAVCERYPGVPETPRSILARAEMLVPLFEAGANKAEELRRVPDETVDAFVSSGLLNILKPHIYGGYELDVHAAMDVLKILSRGCCSSAWVTLVYIFGNWILGLFPEEAQAEAFGAGPFLPAVVASGVGAKATPVAGGYLVSGSWMFGSGSYHSNWGILDAIVERGEIDGPPESRSLLIPRTDYDLKDNWHVMGLTGTGSFDIKVSGVFVPEHRTILGSDVLAGTTPGGRLHKAPSYGLPPLSIFSLATAILAVGAANSALSDLNKRTRARVFGFAGAKQVENVPAQIRLANATTDIEAADLLISDSIRRLEAEVVAGRRPSNELRARCRMNSGYVTRLCKQAVANLVEAAGTKALFDGSPINRAFRDINMMCTHRTLEFDGGAETYGRVLLGLEPTSQLF
jgi:3-hydroxy-9,10-secoandrosta-1,3,5(10)-triene-9,17-dione monooxygenase